MVNRACGDTWACLWIQDAECMRMGAPLLFYVFGSPPRAYIEHGLAFLFHKAGLLTSFQRPTPSRLHDDSGLSCWQFIKELTAAGQSRICTSFPFNRG